MPERESEGSVSKTSSYHSEAANVGRLGPDVRELPDFMGGRLRSATRSAAPATRNVRTAEVSVVSYPHASNPRVAIAPVGDSASVRPVRQTRNGHHARWCA